MKSQNRVFRSIFGVSVGLLVALWTIGCGGSNAQSNGFTGGNTRGSQPLPGDATRGAEPELKGPTLLPIFLSDNTVGPVEQLWVKVFVVRLSTAKDTVPVFEQPNGLWLNLKSLREGNQAKFFLLGAAGVVPKDVTRLVLELGPEVYLQRKDEGPLAKVMLADSMRIDDTRSKAILDIKNQSAASAHVVDFQSARLKADKSNRLTLRPTLGSNAGAEDPSRQIPSRLIGTVSNVGGAPPQVNFQLETGNKRMMKVTAEPATAIFRTDGKAENSLANGLRATVSGAFSLTSQSVEAKAIELASEGEAPKLILTGRSLTIDAEKNTMSLAPVTMSGVEAPASPLQVTLSADFVGVSDEGKALSRAEVLEQVGKFGGHLTLIGSQAEGAITIQRIQLEPASKPAPLGSRGAGVNPDLKAVATQDWTGKISAFDAKVQTVTLEAAAGVIEGRGQAALPRIIQLSEKTLLSNPAGERLTAEQFFKEMAKNPQVKASGRMDGGILKADAIQILP